MKLYSLLYKTQVSELMSSKELKDVLWDKKGDKLNIHKLRKNIVVFGRKVIGLYKVTIEVKENRTKRYYLDSTWPRAIKGVILRNEIISIKPFN